MSAATDRWREVREAVWSDPFVQDAGDTLAAILDRIERVAELENADEPQTGYGAAWREVLRIIRDGS